MRFVRSGSGTEVSGIVFQEDWEEFVGIESDSESEDVIECLEVYNAGLYWAVAGDETGCLSFLECEDLFVGFVDLLGEESEGYFRKSSPVDLKY